MMILEASLGLALVAVLMGLFVAGERQQKKAALTLQGQRAAARDLEAAALGWKAGGRVTPAGLEVESRGGGWVRISISEHTLWVYSPGQEEGGEP